MNPVQESRLIEPSSGRFKPCCVSDVSREAIHLALKALRSEHGEVAVAAAVEDIIQDNRRGDLKEKVKRPEGFIAGRIEIGAGQGLHR